MRARLTDVILVLAAALATLPSTTIARAQGAAAAPTPAQPASPPTNDPTRDAEARRAAGAAFQRGTKLVADAKWADALTAFEEAQSLSPHAITLFNVGACERALGRYAAARETFGAALEVHDRGETPMPKRLLEDASAYRDEISGLLARVRVTVEPANASLAVDGRPLSQRKLIEGADAAAPPVLTAGIRAPGKGEPLPSRTILLELDPGRHVLAFSRPGASDSLVVRDLRSGYNPPLDLALRDLPATIEISADQKGAIVTVDGKDLGPVPLSLVRPAGAYRVVVERDGYQTAEALLRVAAGQQATYRAKLPADEPTVLEKWWFWTIAGVAVSGAVVGTYFATRSEPEPTRQRASDGSLGFKVPIP